MEKSIFKIYLEDRGYGTGFLCKIPFPDSYNLLPTLITSNQVLEENYIIKNKIKISLNNNKISYYLNYDNLRKIYSIINYDITFIEIKKKWWFRYWIIFRYR